MNRNGPTETGYVMLEAGHDEMERLLVQEDIINDNMPLCPPGFQPDGRRILDLACGPGGWALDFAQQYPSAQVVGVDIAKNMIDYAREQAIEVLHLSNVKFHIMNICEPFDCKDASFDFINVRFIEGVMNRTLWKTFLGECYRILRVNGWLRVTTGEASAISFSPAGHRLRSLTMQALYHGEKTFSEWEFAVAPMVQKMARDLGFVDITIPSYTLNYSAGQPLHDPVIEDFDRASVKMKPYLARETGISPEDYDALLAESRKEWASEDYAALWVLLAVVCRKAA